MPLATKQVMSFVGGVNAQAPAHMIGEDQVQTQVNLDFTIEPGAARARRGYVVDAVTSGFNHYGMFQTYRDSGFGTGYLYTNYGSGGGNGVGRMRHDNTVGTYTALFTSLGPGIGGGVGFCKYNNQTYICSANPPFYKDDGTHTTEWILQVPQAPSVTISTGTPIVAISSGSAMVQEGSIAGTATGPVAGTLTATCDPTTGRVNFIKTGSFNFGTTADGFATDTLGIMYLGIGFSDPQQVYRISIDVAWGTTVLTTETTTVTSGTTTSTITTTLVDFPSYWHAEYLPNIGTNAIGALPQPDTLTGALNLSTLTSPINQSTVTTLQGLINADLTPPLMNISFAGNSITNMAVPKLNFQFVGTSTGSSDLWQGSPAVRVIVENYNTSQTVLLTGLQMQGDDGHPLTDMNVGYTWYQTYAQLDADGNFLGESAASPPSTTIQGQNMNGTVVTNGTATGTINGITHIITYRQGGYAQVPYAVATQSYGTTTMTDTLSDLNELMNNEPMTINVAAPDEINNFYILATAPMFDRIFASDGQNLWWSMPGQPATFPLTSFLNMGDNGNNIVGLIVTLPAGLVIVQEQCVQEMNGSVFEGPNVNYVVQRANVRRGSIAPLTVINTPFGIPLVNYDGITMYIPGAGVDEPLPWVMDQIGDAFRGPENADLAAVNGSRVPGINQAITNAAACYNEGKIYLAVPTGSNNFNDTVFVLDFWHKKCWWYQYNEGLAEGTSSSTSVGINSLNWDLKNNKIFAGGTGGTWQLEASSYEQGTNTSAANPIPWSFQSRAWTAPTDALVENFAVEYIGGPFQVCAIFDGTTTQTIGTASATNTACFAHFPLNGVVSNSLVFQFTQLLGTAASGYGPHTAVYSLTFDAYTHPQKVHFYQTDYNDNEYAGDKLWDVEFFDIGFLQGTTTTSGTGTISSTGTVTAVSFIDGVAVMTNTLTGGATQSGRSIFTFSFPAETYGEVAYTTLTSTASGTSSGYFKLWDHRYSCRNEPARTTVWRTTIESLDEAICDAFDVDINPNGTVVGTAFVDNTALMTSTITGTKRQSYTFKLPTEVYGRTIYVLYTSGVSGVYFKHYSTLFHRRPEPDRWTNFVSDRRDAQEQHFDAFECDINPLGNTVTATAIIDGTAYGTFTYTGTLRQGFVNAFPANTYGRTTYAVYNVSTSTDTSLNPQGGRFKFFSDHFKGTTEPDRVNFVQKILPPWPSEHYVKTWIAELNPLGSCTGTFMVDGVALATATFTGTIRESYNVGMEAVTSTALQTATTVELRYSGAGGTGLFKHYTSAIESSPKPFGKLTWAFEYKKTGGASQIDLARFWAIDVETPPSTTVLMTSIWDIDGQPGFSTNTLTLTNQRTYIDRIPFPPGGRGRLFQQRIAFSAPSKVWRTTIQQEHIGVKGLSVITVNGNPTESSWDAMRYSDQF